MFAAPAKQISYDDILLETLAFLRKNWLNPDVGIVACCLIDGDKKAFATSSKNGTYWRHAERNAYLAFKDQYKRDPSPSAAFVVTLSPCASGLKHRAEESCTDLLNQLGIKRVHFGVLDTMHATSLDDYKKYNLHPSLAEQPACKTLCEKLMALFATYDARINSDLIGIKRELGEEFFAELDPRPIAAFQAKA